MLITDYGHLAIKVSYRVVLEITTPTPGGGGHAGLSPPMLVEYHFVPAKLLQQTNKVLMVTWRMEQQTLRSNNIIAHTVRWLQDGTHVMQNNSFVICMVTRVIMIIESLDLVDNQSTK